MNIYLDEKVFYRNINIRKNHVDIDAWLFINRHIKNLLLSKEQFEKYDTDIRIPYELDNISEDMILKEKIILLDLGVNYDTDIVHKKIYESIGYLFRYVKETLDETVISLKRIIEIINKVDISEEIINILKPIKNDMETLNAEKIFPIHDVRGNYRKMDVYFSTLVKRNIFEPKIRLSEDFKENLHRVMTNLVQNLHERLNGKNLKDPQVLLDYICEFTKEEFGESFYCQMQRFFEEKEELLQPDIPEISVFILHNAYLDDIKYWIQFFASFIICISYGVANLYGRNIINLFDLYEIVLFDNSMENMNFFFSKEAVQKFSVL